MNKTKNQNINLTNFARGKVKKVCNMADLKHVTKGDIVYVACGGDILCLAMLAIDKGVSGFIGNFGRTNHGVIAAKELGIPFCLTDEEPKRNTVYSILDNKLIVGDIKAPSNTKHNTTHIYTKKMVCVNMGSPKRCISKISNLPTFADGVGFARMEFAILEVVSGEHPLRYIKRHGAKKFSDDIYEHFKHAVKAFGSKVFWIRTDDFSPNHFFSLKGGKNYEKETDNEIVGFRGIARAIDEKWLDLGYFESSLKGIGWLELQLNVIDRLAKEFPETKIGLFAPMVHNVEEYKTWKSLSQKFVNTKIDYGVMVEVPALTGEGIKPFLQDEIIDFMIFGTNDLTSLTLAIDRFDARLSHLFDEEHPAVTSSMAKTIEYCRAKGVLTAIGGQAASRPSMMKFLYKVGIDIFSVNPDIDTIYNAKKVLRELENK